MTDIIDVKIETDAEDNNVNVGEFDYVPTFAVVTEGKEGGVNQLWTEQHCDIIGLRMEGKYFTIRLELLL